MGAIRRLLIANRGEIAIRIARAADEMGIATAGVFARDDARSLHVKAMDDAVALEGEGPVAYLDIAKIVAAARDAGCDAVHPGYGFLSERADFAAACVAAGLVFVGPDADMLALFGDKARAKEAARAAGVPVLDGADADGAVAFMASLPAGAAVMLKAVAGGGGRGMRVVRDRAALEAALAACRAEAGRAFGEDDVLAERYVPHARHVEVQVAGDGANVVALGTRDCSIQRRHQKLIEIAPASGLSRATEDALAAAATALLTPTGYRGLATVEFLVDPASDDFFFLEVNPRLQVEHTVTEQVSGRDLVQLQLRLAMGETIAALGLDRAITPVGVAIQLRINAETLAADGTPQPAGGTLTAYEPPSGPGVRVDGAGYAGYALNPRYDPLLAKLIVTAADLPGAIARGRRALAEFRIAGAPTNRDLLGAVLAHPDFARGAIDTNWFEAHVDELITAEAPTSRHFTADVPTTATATVDVPEGLVAIRAPMAAVLVDLAVGTGDVVRAGATIGHVEALKMQHAIVADVSGVVDALLAAPGEALVEGQPLVLIVPGEVAGSTDAGEATVDPDHIRADLAEMYARHALGLDDNRPDAVARRRRTGQRTARENIADLFDPGSFDEYGALAIAAQRRRRKLDDLMRETPADGLVTGVGTVNAGLFGAEASGCVGLAYDYTVLAGTQGHWNHRKTDRILEVAAHGKLPIVFFTEGGGGRPGDVDAPGATGLDTTSFAAYARLSGTAPRIGITAGYCFAGNAVFFGASDITIAVEGSNIGMGGPAMIEGGGLGRFSPKEVGPLEVQWRNGVVDARVPDERAGAALARTLLGHFQGRLASWDCADQRLLRHAIPENRVRTFDVRRVIALLADEGSFVELRGGFARGMITGLLRIEGRSVGLIANDNAVMGGVIDADGADKAARFMQLCDAFGLPILSLCDTPGFMVGPDSERAAPVRHGARMFVVAQSLTVPVFAVVLRKGYGLGAQAMTGGSFPAARFTVAWPTGEFGGMGLEGAVRLGYRKELEAIADAEARDAFYRERVAAMYAAGKAVSVAQVLEVDAVIDPADTRGWLARGLAATPPARGGRFIDTW